MIFDIVLTPIIKIQELMNAGINYCIVSLILAKAFDFFLPPNLLHEQHQTDSSQNN
jgi:hypothetical protein